MDASDSDVWVTFALSSKELKRRGLVRTRNFTGERGEFLAIRTYKDIPGLPNLQAAPEGAQNVDAISRKGDRYSIKTITEPGKATGVFYGCGNKDDDIVADKKFEYVIIVIINDDYKLMRMYEINWNQFLEIRKWHATMRAWYLSINKNLIDLAKVIV
ncbi:MAG: hypothetical protein HGA33_03055 [Candidatus Moranbacteria bacterium]|nr:hypothetical protein [Candidatus Moranbacteria bacterium]